MEYNDNRELLNNIKKKLLDPLAIELANSIEWLQIKDFSRNSKDLYPIAITGQGPKIILLHGFDSCFLEFRRLTPFLKENYKLIIPDLYGFGFCPRPKDGNYGMKFLVKFIQQILIQVPEEKPIGIIGASMGGGLAMEIARKNPDLINRLLLLSPAGLCGKNMKLPWPLDQAGVCILQNGFIRKKLCQQAFSDPKNNVGKQEEQIASIHLQVPGWRRSLAAFARNGGVSNCGSPLPLQPLNVLYGAKDRIIPQDEKMASKKLLKNKLEEIPQCGHLPHLEKPHLVAKIWRDGFQSNQ